MIRRLKKCSCRILVTSAIGIGGLAAGILQAVVPVAAETGGGRMPAAASAAASAAPSLEELRNASYAGFEEPRGSVQLEAGRWEGQPYEKGGASRPTVTFVRGFRLAGDLDGDGAEEAAILLAFAGGGSGELVYLAVVGRKGGAALNLATVLVGDRVDVRAGRVAGSRVVLDLVQPGEGDASCCPGDLVTRSWTLDGAALREGEPQRTGRLSPEALAGAEWRLRFWTLDEPASAEPAVTVRYEGGRFAGSSGCNRYTAAVTAGATPGDIAVGPAAGTRMMCGEPEMAVESRFLKALGGVKRFSFFAGQLALTSGQGGTMLFDPGPIDAGARP